MSAEFKKAQLRKYHEACHKAAMDFIDLVTNAAGEQMKIEGITIDTLNFEISELCKLASRNLNADEIELEHDYVEMLILEGMAEKA